MFKTLINPLHSINSVCVCECYRNDQSLPLNTEINSAPSSISPEPYIKYVISFLKSTSVYMTLVLSSSLTMFLGMTFQTFSSSHSLSSQKYAHMWVWGVLMQHIYYCIGKILPLLDKWCYSFYYKIISM